MNNLQFSRAQLVNKVRVLPQTDCWEFKGSLDAYGYGRMYAYNKELKAHRVFFEFFGPECTPAMPELDDDHVLQHYLPRDKCIGHACCNPRHMRISLTNKGPEYKGSELKIELKVSPIQSRRQKLMAKVLILPETGCWRWSGTVHEKGFGRLYENSKQKAAHVVYAEEWGGPVPEGMFVHHDLPAHRCIGDLCCNPQHMSLSGQRKSAKRTAEKIPVADSIPASAPKRCPNGHLMTPDNVVTEKRNGHPKQRCRTCRQESWRKNSARRAAGGHHS